MKKKTNSSMKAICVVLVVLAAAAAGFSAGCFYQCQKSTIALVDVSAVVNGSAQVQQLKAEQIANVQALSDWLKAAQEAVQKEENAEKQEELAQKYNAELEAKRNEIRDQYIQKLQNINESITKIISDEAKKKGYKTVIAKGVAVYGSDDITQEVMKAIK